MRPVTKQPRHAKYSPPQKLLLGGTVAALFQKIAGVTSATPTYQIPLTLALQVLLDHVTGLRIRRITPAEQTVLASGLMQRISKIYKTAALPLTDELGAFCSYCGTALPGLIEVEHALPKSHFPYYAVEWKNFLLACSPCNTCKADDPDRKTATSWAQAFSPTEQQLHNSIRQQHYIWPDLNAGCWQALPNQLQYLDPKVQTWTVLNAAESVSAGIRLTAYDVIQHKVLANLDASIGGGPFGDVEVAVVVRDANGRATEMIDLLGLNADSSSVFDRRLMNRTRAWFDALEECRLLSRVDPDPKHNWLWPITLRRAASSGFYSVWLTVMQAFDNSHGTHYAKAFVNDSASKLYYPSTNISQLPC